MKARGALLAVLAVAVAPAPVQAGSYVFAGDANGLDVVTHPPNYTGAGGIVTVNVCIDPAAANAEEMEIPIMNVMTRINAMVAESPNLLFGGDNDIPPGSFDFESLALHEIGHCTGLQHPNLGVQTGVTGDDTEFTQSTDGLDDMFSFNDGADNVKGTSDDVRADDVNLHWFEIDVNNPYLIPGTIDSSTYSRDVANLPTGHVYPANAGRDVGDWLGFTDTEAVMQQGQGSDEDQRRLAADDVATYAFAATGLDETVGGGDDYTINMVYIGMTTPAMNPDCDILVTSTTTGFGVCSINGSFLSSTHAVITSATFSYNAIGSSWHFNDQLLGACTSPDDDLVISGVENGVTVIEACNSIVFQNYTVGPTGDVTAIAPDVSFENDVTIEGTLVVDTSVP